MPPPPHGDELASFPQSIPNSTQLDLPKTPADAAPQIPPNPQIQLPGGWDNYDNMFVDDDGISSLLPDLFQGGDSLGDNDDFAALMEAGGRACSPDADMFGVNGTAAPQAAPPVPVCGGGGGHGHAAAPCCATGTAAIQHLREKDAQRRLDSWKQNDVEQEQHLFAEVVVEVPEDGHPSCRDADMAEVNEAATVPVRGGDEHKEAQQRSRLFTNADFISAVERDLLPQVDAKDTLSSRLPTHVGHRSEKNGHAPPLLPAPVPRKMPALHRPPATGAGQQAGTQIKGRSRRQGHLGAMSAGGGTSTLGAGGPSGSGGPVGSGGGGGPCGSCKLLRRKCGSDCIFAPYFDSQQGAAKYEVVDKMFAAANWLRQIHEHCIANKIFAIHEQLTQLKLEGFTGRMVRFTGPDSKGRKPHQAGWKEKSMTGMRAVADPSSPQPPPPPGQQEQQCYVGFKKTLELDDDGKGNKWRASEYTPLLPSDDGTNKLVPAEFSLRFEFKEDKQEDEPASPPQKRKEDEPPQEATAFTKRPKMAPKKSRVWEHMTPVHVKVAPTSNKDGTQRKKNPQSNYKVMYAICHHCDQVFNADSSHGTHNLSNHLDRCNECKCTHSHSR